MPSRPPPASPVYQPKPSLWCQLHYALHPDPGSFPGSCSLEDISSWISAPGGSLVFFCNYSFICVLSTYYVLVTGSTGMGRHPRGDGGSLLCTESLGWGPWGQRTEVAAEGQDACLRGRRGPGTWCVSGTPPRLGVAEDALGSLQERCGHRSRFHLPPWPMALWGRELCPADQP